MLLAVEFVSSRAGIRAVLVVLIGQSPMSKVDQLMMAEGTASLATTRMVPARMNKKPVDIFFEMRTELSQKLSWSS